MSLAQELLTLKESSQLKKSWIVGMQIFIKMVCMGGSSVPTLKFHILINLGKGMVKWNIF